MASSGSGGDGFWEVGLGRANYRVIFRVVYGLGPWPCFVCGELIYDRRSTPRAEQLAIHHVDEDHGNDDPANLVPTHHGCHTRFHRVGTTASAETRRKMSAGVIQAYGTGKKKPVTWTDEARQAISEAVKRAYAEGRHTRVSAFRGKKHTPETLEKMRRSNRNYQPEVRAKISAANKGLGKGRTLPPETREKLRLARLAQPVFRCACGREIRGRGPFLLHERACSAA